MINFNTENFLLILLGLALASCTGSRKLAGEQFSSADISAVKLVDGMPNYQRSLKTVKGKGRAIVSEPGNTEHVKLLFASNRTKSLITIKNSLGIEGGKLLTDGDSLLIYNKVDKYARKLPVRGSELNRINELASLNILQILSYTIDKNEVKQIDASKNHYRITLNSGTRVFLDKQTLWVKRVIQPEDSGLPYSKILYDAYSTIKGYKLPRKISIFSANKKSKISLQITGLDVNAELDSLKIMLPDNIPVYYR